MRLLFSFLLVASAWSADLLTTQGGTALRSGDWTQITGASGVVPTNGVAIGYDKSFYVSPLDMFMQLAIGRAISGEPNKAYVGYSLSQNAWFVLDIGGNSH